MVSGGADKCGQVGWPLDEAAGSLAMGCRKWGIATADSRLSLPHGATALVTHKLSKPQTSH